MHALRFGDAVYDVANALRERSSRARASEAKRDRASASRVLVLCILLFLARWRHHAQVCQCPGSKRVNFRSAPFASLFRTELEISESARAAIPKYAFESARRDARVVDFDEIDLIFERYIRVCDTFFLSFFFLSL